MVWEVKTNWMVSLYTPLFFGWTISLSPALETRNQVCILIGLSYRPASLCSLATQFQTRFLESIPRPIAGLKFSTQILKHTSPNHTSLLYTVQYSIPFMRISQETWTLSLGVKISALSLHFCKWKFCRLISGPYFIWKRSFSQAGIYPESSEGRIGNWGPGSNVGLWPFPLQQKIYVNTAALLLSCLLFSLAVSGF